MAVSVSHLLRSLETPHHTIIKLVPDGPMGPRGPTLGSHGTHPGIPWHPPWIPMVPTLGPQWDLQGGPRDTTLDLSIIISMIFIDVYIILCDCHDVMPCHLANNMKNAIS
mgnify:CR=1 FL=1